MKLVFIAEEANDVGLIPQFDRGVYTTRRFSSNVANSRSRAFR